VNEYIRIIVEGVPAPKGSFRISSRGRGRKPIVRKDSPKTEAWEHSVKWEARHWMRGHGRAPFVDQALSVTVYFRMPRPDGHYVHPAGGLIRRSKADAVPAVQPDIDKLLRSTFDALEGEVYDQDSRIVSVMAHKGYVQEGEAPGAVITIERYGGDS
jgi:Holliday junction resolvase RusA-like endonuclease